MAGMFREFFEERGLDGDLILIQRLVEHGSYKKVAEALEEQYGLSVSSTTIRYHAKRLKLDLRVVYRRWLDKPSEDLHHKD